jgi:inorganic pyrophosphatase
MAIQRIPPLNPKTGTINVIIETPKGSRNKYAFDPTAGVIALSRILPLGIHFPFDFGFIPQTTAPDGDPLDALVMFDDPVFPGCLVECRPLGVIEAEQTESGETTRNDRIIAVPAISRRYQPVQALDDLVPTVLDEIRNFFTSYHEIQGRKFRPIANRGPETAIQLIEQAHIDW